MATPSARPSGTASKAMHDDLMSTRGSRYAVARANRIRREQDHRDGVVHETGCIRCEDERASR